MAGPQNGEGQNLPAKQPYDPGVSLARVDTLGQAGELAKVFIQSKFFKDTEALSQGIVKIMYGQELGLPPLLAMTSIDVVEGKPTPSANLTLAKVSEHPRYDYLVGTVDAEGAEVTWLRLLVGVDPEDAEPFRTMEQPGDWQVRGTSKFTIEDAKRAGLVKDHPKSAWKAHPDSMCFARAVTIGVRRFCPDVFHGLTAYTSEELGGEVQFDDLPPGAVVEEESTIDAAPVVDTADAQVIDEDPDPAQGDEAPAESEADSPATGEAENESEGKDTQEPAESDTDGDSQPKAYDQPEDWSGEGDSWQRWCWYLGRMTPDGDPEAPAADKVREALQHHGIPNPGFLADDAMWRKALKEGAVHLNAVPAELKPKAKT